MGHVRTTEPIHLRCDVFETVNEHIRWNGPFKSIRSNRSTEMEKLGPPLKFGCLHGEDAWFLVFVRFSLSPPCLRRLGQNPTEEPQRPRPVKSHSQEFIEDEPPAPKPVQF